MYRTRRFRLTLAFFFIVGILIGSLSFHALAAENNFAIKVQATGDVRVSPDKAQMWIGAQTDGPTASEALALSNETVQKLIEIFTKFTKSEVIKASEFNMYQKERWDEAERRSVPEGFTVRHVFEVAVSDLANVAPMLDEVTAAGANIIYGLQYGVQDARLAREEAYAKAVEDAWWKAKVIAEASGGTDLILESIEELYYYGPEYGAEGIGAVTEQPDLFMPGQLKVSVSINATFRADLTKSE